MQNKNVAILKKLRDKIGKELFNEVVEEHRSEALRFPSDPEYFDKLERNEKLMEDFHIHKMKVPDLAAKYNLSVSYVYKLTEKR